MHGRIGPLVLDGAHRSSHKSSAPSLFISLSGGKYIMRLPIKEALLLACLLTAITPPPQWKSAEKDILAGFVRA